MNLILVTEDDEASEEEHEEDEAYNKVRFEQTITGNRYVLPKDDPRTIHIKKTLKSETGDIIRLGILNQAKGTATLK